MTFASRELSAARLGTRFRLVLARRPWLRWLCVGAVAAIATVAVHDRLDAADAARAAWLDRVPVPVADEAAAPGDLPQWRWRELPAIAVPDDVAADVPDDARLRRHVGRGEIIVSSDLSDSRGPAAGAEPGEVVVPVSDPLVTHPEVGLAVAVYSDGVVLARTARIVHVEAEVVFVAVGADEAPTIAAAAQTSRASIAFVRPGD